jgi:hypothetical protein
MMLAFTYSEQRRLAESPRLAQAGACGPRSRTRAEPDRDGRRAPRAGPRLVSRSAQASGNGSSRPPLASSRKRGPGWPRRKCACRLPRSGRSWSPAPMGRSPSAPGESSPSVPSAGSRSAAPTFSSGPLPPLQEDDHDLAHPACTNWRPRSRRLPGATGGAWRARRFGAGEQHRRRLKRAHLAGSESALYAHHIPHSAPAHLSRFAGSATQPALPKRRRRLAGVTIAP